FTGPVTVRVRGRNEYFPAGTGFGIVKLDGFEGWTVMLWINGAIYNPNAPSVLSSIQIKAAYHVVNNTPRMYKGKQSIQLDQELHFLYIPLVYRKRFCYMRVIK